MPQFDLDDMRTWFYSSIVNILFTCDINVFTLCNLLFLVVFCFCLFVCFVCFVYYLINPRRLHCPISNQLISPHIKFQKNVS